MMRLHDATRLAFTKLRTRKLRLFVTVFISCLLFSLLATASFVFRGAIRSAEDFGQEGFGSRYIIQAYAVGSASESFYSDPQQVDKATILYKDLVARKKAEATRLGVSYDATTEPLPYAEIDGPGGKLRTLNQDNPVVIKLYQEYLAAHPQPGLPELKEAAKNYQPKAFYSSEMRSFSSLGPSLQVIKNGKEKFDTQQSFASGGPQTGMDSFAQSWQLMSGGLLEPFMLPGTTRAVGKDGVLPVVAPYSAVEQLLSLKPLPTNASPEQKLERLKTLRQKAATLNFTVCYRNHASSASVTQAQQMQQEILQQKNNKDYQLPSLVYDVPSEPCGAVRVTRDVRTADEKALDAKQEQFRREFGEEAPKAAMLLFRVIGIAPDPFTGPAAGVEQLFASVLTSTLGTGWYTPLEAQEANPLLATIFTTQGSIYGSSVNFVEFGSDRQALAFRDDKSCKPDFSPPPAAPTGTIGFNPFSSCRQAAKPFVLEPFGSSSLALAGLKQGFTRFFMYAALVIAVLAAIIMMGTLGRIIADSRRETAVFRAIGAKQLDITQIYVTYILMVALLIAALGIILGFVLASFIDAKYAHGLTVKALLVYNAKDLSKSFHLYAFWLKDMVYLVLVILAAALVSTVFPLLHNVRRNPIRDMRDDT